MLNIFTDLVQYHKSRKYHIFGIETSDTRIRLYPEPLPVLNILSWRHFSLNKNMNSFALLQ